jgi:hypothetical protein
MFLALTNTASRRFLAIVGSAVQLLELSLLIGIPLAVLLGFPSFLFLAKRGWATYWSAVAIGLLPTVALLAYGLRPIAFLFAPYGLVVALLAFFLASRPQTAEHAP